MKRIITLIVILSFILSNTDVFGQTQNGTPNPSFRGARTPPYIASLNASYCQDVGNVDIVPNTWETGTTMITWKVSASNTSNPDQPTWYTITGTGKSTVLHFNPSAVPSIYFGVPIVFSYIQSDGIGDLSVAYDYTYIYKIPTVYNFGSDTTLCPGQSASLKLSNSETIMKYILLRDGTPVDSLTGTGSSLTFSPSTVGTYTVQAHNISNATCSKPMTGAAVVKMFPINTPTITGINNTDICIGTLGVKYTTEAGQSGYVWTVSAGGTITGGLGTKEITVDWNTIGAQTVTVNYANANGCMALTPTSKAVTIHALPIPTLTGNASVCINSTINYSTDAGMGNYVWTVSAGGTITAGGTTNTISVNWTTLGAKTITATYTDIFGCVPVAPTTYNVTVYDRPVPTITGAQTFCAGTSGVIYSTEAAQSSYNWVLSPGGTITSGAGTNTITVTWNTAGPQTVSINYNNPFGCPALLPTILNVTVNPLPVPTISGNDSICLGETNTIYNTESGMSNYIWAVSGGGSINSGSGTDQIDMTWTTIGNKTVSVNYKNSFGCVAPSPTVYNVVVSPLPVPTIIGVDTVCAGVPNVTYTTQPGQKAYNWIISPGGTLSSGGGTYQIGVTWNTPGDNWVSVNYENSANCSAPSSFVTNTFVRVRPTPTIVGPSSFCLDTASVKTYTTEAGQNSYNWVVSAGGVIQSGAGTNVITVKWNTVGAKTVTINYKNSVGCQAPSPTVYNVTVNPLPIPTISGLGVVCAGVTGVTYTTEPGMSSYNWILAGGGGTITSGAGTNQITVTWNTAGVDSITVNYNNAFGCTAPTAAKFYITVNTAPSPTITGTTTVCEGATNVMYTTEVGMNAYVWTISAGGAITAGGASNAVHVTWNNSGANTISVNYQNAIGCPAALAVSLPINVLPEPVPTISGPTPTCVGTSTYSTDPGMSAYNWTVSAGGTITAGAGTESITVQWTTSGPQTLSLSYTNGAGCSTLSPTIYNVTVNPLPTPTITGVGVVCAGTTGVIYSTELGMSAYNWVVSAGGTITGGVGTNQIIVTWNSVGAGTVSVNYKNAFGCQASTPTVYNTTVNPRPSPTITGQAGVCVGASNVTYMTEAGMSNYTWTVSAGGTITSGVGTNTIQVTWNTVGANSISVNYENAFACPAASPIVLPVTVFAKPVPTITGPNPACIGNAVYTTEPGMSVYTWTVSAGGTIISGAGTESITVQWTTSGAKTITVNYTNGGGCTAVSATILNLMVNPSPAPTISGLNNTCADGSNITYTTEAGMSAYTWGVSAGGTITSGAGTNSITVQWTTGGPKLISVNYVNAFGCLAVTPTVYNVTVNPLPTPLITGFGIVCKGNTGITYITDPGMSNYVWTISAGGTITAGLGTNQITVTWNTIGPQTITVNYKNSNLCTASAPTIYNVTVNPLPVPTITASNLGCIGSSTTYTTDAGMSSYVWTTSAGGTITSGAGTNSITVNWNVLGAQTVTVTYVTPSGCQPLAPTVNNITVHNLPVPTITGSNSLCQGSPGNIYSTEAGMNNYLWAVSAGGTITSGGGTNQIQVTWNTAGPQTVSINYDDINGCSALTQTVYNVTVKPAPIPTITGLLSMCAGTTGITYNTEAGMSGYNWSVSAGGTITGGALTNVATVSWNTGGVQTITASYTGLNGCVSIPPTVQNINVNYVLATLTPSPGTTICDGTSTTFTASASGGLGASNYDFYIISHGAVPVQSGISATYNTSTLVNGDKVYVKITDLNGCQDYSDTIIMTVAPNPVISLSVTSTGGNSVCSGDLVQFKATAGLAHYDYYINGVLNDNGANPNYSSSTIQNGDQVYVKGTSIFGCSSNSTPPILMNVFPLPVAGLSANPGTSIIHGTNVVFTASGVGDYQFLVNGIMIQDYSPTNTFSSNTLNNGDIITLNVKNTNGCISSTNLTMSVLGDITPLVVQVNPSEYCVGDPTGATVFINNPESGLTYELIRVSNGQNLGAGVVSGSVVKWNNVFNTAAGTEQYKVVAYYPAFPAVQIEMSNRVSIKVDITPTVFNMTPTGTVNDCNGGAGYEIKLNNSEIGVTYSLYMNGVTTGITVIGTGSAISFGFQNVGGTYTVVATNSSAGCAKNMNGSFIMNIASALIKYNILANPGSGHFCEGTAGVDITLSGSSVGVDYILLRDNIVNLDTISGTGAALDFGYYDVEGVYTIAVSVTGCPTPMNGTVNVVKDALPIAYNVTATNNGVYCAGGVGVTISLSNQQTGIQYQLLYNGNPVGAPVSGTLPGAILDFPGLHTQAGVYSVQQTIPLYGCPTTTSSNALVSIVPIPNDLNIQGETSFCEGGVASIYIDNSEADVLYKVYKDGIYNGTSSLGNGGRLSFTVNQEGTYKLFATRTTSGTTCPFQLSSQIVVTKTILPEIKNYTWVNGSSCSNGTVITVQQSQVGVVYKIYSRVTGLPLPGYSIVGNGNDISFPGIIDSNGDYYVVAENGGCPVEFTNFGDIHVAIPNVAAKMQVTQPAAICAGADGVIVGLNNTELNINYDLYLVGGDIATGNDLLVQSIVGNGSAMNFPAKLYVEGTYYVIGKNNSVLPACPVEMLNRVQVVFHPLPKVFDMVGSGVFCAGMPGAIIGLQGTELGIKYFLQYNKGLGNVLVDSIIGSGNPINFNNDTIQAIYSVYAVSPFGCTTNMNKTITVVKKANPNLYTISVDNTKYCGASLGADLMISGTQKDVTYVITNVITNVVINFIAPSDNATQVKLATVPEGDYLVDATWAADACITNLTPTPVSVNKAPLPTTPINITIDDLLICSGDSTFVRVTNVQSGLMYDLMKDNVLQNRVINSATNPVKWMVNGLAGADNDYKVYAYFNGYNTCGLESSKVVNLKVKAPPTSFALSPSNYSSCFGQAGISFTVSGSEANVIYELYDASHTRVDNYFPTGTDVGNPFTFSKKLSGGTYTLISSYVTGRCSSLTNSVSVITEDDSSFVCFPFEAIPDTLYLNQNQNSSSIYVSYPAKGGNDIINALIDINMSYRLITSWVDKNGNNVQTKGTVSFDSTNKDYFTYQKTPSFFGKDSVLYEMTNIDHPNRKDTAVIYILVGNKETEDQRIIMIPNAFTPNGDGKNDKFIIAGYDDQISSVLQVFNRWGALVYESNGQNYLNDWDGTGNKGVTISIGKQLPIGTYFYVYNVSFKQKENIVKKKYSGFVELRR